MTLEARTKAGETFRLADEMKIGHLFLGDTGTKMRLFYAKRREQLVEQMVYNTDHQRHIDLMGRVRMLDELIATTSAF